MQISEGIFLPDASRPQSEMLIYDAPSKIVKVISAQMREVQSVGGIGAWVVEVTPGDFDVVSDDVFKTSYRLPEEA